MKHQTMWKLLSLILLVMIVLPAYSQGVYWEVAMSGGPAGDNERVSKMYHMPNRLKSVEADGEMIIVWTDKEVLYRVDPKKKTYSEMTFEQLHGAMKKTGDVMSERMAEMQKQMEGMSDEERKMVERMMGSRMPGMKKDSKIDLQKTGEKETIGGHACTKVVVMEDEKTLLTVWVTKEVKEFAGMKKDMEAFRKLTAALNPMIPKGLSEAMQKIDGFPMVVEMNNGVRQEVKKIEKRSISASEFEIPSDYEKVDLKLMEGMEH